MTPLCVDLGWAGISLRLCSLEEGICGYKSCDFPCSRALLTSCSGPCFGASQTQSTEPSLAALCRNCLVSPKEEFCLPGHDTLVSRLQHGCPCLTCSWGSLCFSPKSPSSPDYGPSCSVVLPGATAHMSCAQDHGRRCPGLPLQVPSTAHPSAPPSNCVGRRQLGKFGGVYSTPDVEETLAALHWGAGKSRRCPHLQEALRGLILLYLGNIPILI